MKKNIIDLLDEAVKNIPGELHREGKNLIGYEPLLSKEHCYIIYPDKRACLIDYDYETKKSIIIRELTEEESKILRVEDL
jgi:hypothetical protein